jgi:hypothetical protein
MTILNQFQQLAATVALKKLFAGNYFSICDLDTLMKLTGAVAPTKDYQALQCLHCVHWGDMSPELRNMVMQKVVDIVQNIGFDTEILNGRLLNARAQLTSH